MERGRELASCTRTRTTALFAIPFQPRIAARCVPNQIRRRGFVTRCVTHRRNGGAKRGAALEAAPKMEGAFRWGGILFRRSVALALLRARPRGGGGARLLGGREASQS